MPPAPSLRRRASTRSSMRGGKKMVRVEQQTPPTRPRSRPKEGIETAQKAARATKAETPEPKPKDPTIPKADEMAKVARKAEATEATKDPRRRSAIDDSISGSVKWMKKR